MYLTLIFVNKRVMATLKKFYSDIDYQRLTVPLIKQVIRESGFSITVSKRNKQELISALRFALTETTPRNIHPILKQLETPYNPIPTHRDQSKIDQIPPLDAPLGQTTVRGRSAYELLPDKHFDHIFMIRDMQKSNHGKATLIAELEELDTLLPDWKQEIINLNITGFQGEISYTNKVKMFMHGAFHGLDMRMLEDFTADGVRDIINMWKFVATPKPVPGQAVNIEIDPNANWAKGTKEAEFRKSYQYISGPSLNHIWKNVILNDLKYYPPTTKSRLLIYLLKETYEKIDIMFKNYVKSFYPSINPGAPMPFIDKIFLLTRGYMVPLGTSVKRRKWYERIAQYESLDDMQKNALLQLYKIEGAYDPIQSLLMKPDTAVSPLEPYIFAMKTAPIPDLALRMGMCLPSSVIENESELRYYFINNINKYANLFDRNTKFSPGQLNHNTFPLLTDSEIFTLLDAYIPYKNRDELLKNAADFCIGARNFFFIPSIQAKQSKHVLNKDNLTIIMRNRVDNPSLFLIGFGNHVRGYHLYELDDLLSSFIIKDIFIDSRNSVKRMIFRIPNMPMHIFSSQEIEELQVVLTNYQGLMNMKSPEMSQLLDMISKGLEINNKLNNQDPYDNYALGVFSNFSQDSKDKIYKFLYEIFYAGMYMRRWKGPGFPYPVFKFETMTQIDPDERSSASLVNIRLILDDMKEKCKNFCEELHLLDINQSVVFKVDHMDFKTAYQRIGYERDNKSCIRVSSTYFIGTACYYLKLFFREDIPNFSIQQIANVQ